MSESSSSKQDSETSASGKSSKSKGASGEFTDQPGFAEKEKNYQADRERLAEEHGHSE